MRIMLVLDRICEILRDAFPEDAWPHVDRAIVWNGYRYDTGSKPACPTSILVSHAGVAQGSSAPGRFWGKDTAVVANVAIKVSHRLGEFSNGMTPYPETVMIDEQIIATLSGAILGRPDDDAETLAEFKCVMPGQYVSSSIDLEEAGLISIIQFAYEMSIAPFYRDPPADFVPNRIFVTTELGDVDEDGNVIERGPDLLAERGTPLDPVDC